MARHSGAPVLGRRRARRGGRARRCPGELVEQGVKGLLGAFDRPLGHGGPPPGDPRPRYSCALATRGHAVAPRRADRTVTAGGLVSLDSGHTTVWPYPTRTPLVKRSRSTMLASLAALALSVPALLGAAPCRQLGGRQLRHHPPRGADHHRRRPVHGQLRVHGRHRRAARPGRPLLGHRGGDRHRRLRGRVPAARHARRDPGCRPPRRARLLLVDRHGERRRDRRRTPAPTTTSRSCASTRATTTRSTRPCPVFGGPAGIDTDGAPVGEQVYTYGNSSLRLRA